MHRIRPCGRASADGRNVLSAKNLAQASVEWLGSKGRNPAMDTRIGLREERLVCKKSDILSATRVIAAGFNRVKASTRPGR